MSVHGEFQRQHLGEVYGSGGTLFSSLYFLFYFYFFEICCCFGFTFIHKASQNPKQNWGLAYLSYCYTIIFNFNFFSFSFLAEHLHVCVLKLIVAQKIISSNF